MFDDIPCAVNAETPRGRQMCFALFNTTLLGCSGLGELLLGYLYLELNASLVLSSAT